MAFLNLETLNNKTKKGWYEYGDIFINVLTALDDCTNENGTIEIANKYASNDFDKLIHYTKKNGTPELNMEAVRENIFEKILLQKEIWFSLVIYALINLKQIILNLIEERCIILTLTKNLISI